MQISTKKRGSQPWWVILLLIPMLVSCAAPVAIFWEVAVSVGNRLAGTVVGQVIEVVVDKLIEIIIHSTSLGYTIPDPNDPLKGTYSTTMKFTANYGGESIIYELIKPRMVRDSISSQQWQLAPDLQDLVKQKLTSGSSN